MITTLKKIIVGNTHRIFDYPVGKIAEKAV